MERCQETSQAPPIDAEVTAKAPHQMYQGTLEVFEATSERVCLSAYGVGKVEEAIEPRSRLAPILYVAVRSIVRRWGVPPPRGILCLTLFLSTTCMGSISPKS